MTVAISISNVHKYYGDVHALRGVDLTIEKGEFFGLLGPNGAGKSTLINIIAGLTRASSGDVQVLGRDVISQYRDARRCIGIVPQEVVYDPFFNVREILKIQSGYFGLGNENNDWIDELLYTLKLEDKADTNMRSLSGGMKRRVLIAQALVHKPEVVVLDEPTAGVDVELRGLLWKFISGLHQQGHTIVLTTHYLEEAENFCDRIAIMNHGEIVALDSKQSLLNREIGSTLRVEVHCIAQANDIPDSLRGALKYHDETRLEFEIEKSADGMIALLTMLRDAGIEVHDVKTHHADLEDVFITLTKSGAKGSPEDLA